MAIVKRLDSNKKYSKSADDFIGSASDSTNSEAAQAPAHKARTMKGHQAQITLALPLELLERANAMAYKLSISRAAFMKQAISRAVEAEGV